MLSDRIKGDDKREHQSPRDRPVQETPSTVPLCFSVTAVVTRVFQRFAVDTISSVCVCVFLYSVGKEERPRQGERGEWECFKDTPAHINTHRHTAIEKERGKGRN